MGVLIFSVTFVFLRRTEQDVIKMCVAVHVKNPLILSYIKETWIDSTDIQKILKNKFHEDPSGESRVVPRGQMGGQTDVTKLTVAFQKFANSHKNWYMFLSASLNMLLN